MLKDDTTRMEWVRPIKMKNKNTADVAAIAKWVLADVGGRVEYFRIDNGTEIANKPLLKLCNHLIFRHGHNGGDRPPHNGVVNHEVGLVEMA